MSAKIGEKWNNMIYFLTGKDSRDTLGTLQNLLSALKKKRPGADVYNFSPLEWDQIKFEETLGGQGLFEQKYIVVIESLFSETTSRDLLESKIKEMKESSHAFVVVEYDPSAAIKNSLKKVSEKTWEIKPISKIQKDFNIFSLTDALGERNRTKLWKLYHKATDAGAEPEEILGLLFWQTKSLIAAAKSKTATDAGLKPFVYSKSKSFIKNYSVADLEKMSGDLIRLYHDAHGGVVQFDLALEEFVLGL